MLPWVHFSRQELRHSRDEGVHKVPIASIITLCSSCTEKAMATHSSTLAWKTPWTEEPGRLQSMESLQVGHNWVTSLSLFTFMHWRRKWQPTPVFLPGESQGTADPGGLPSMGSHRVGHDWSDLAAAVALPAHPGYVLNRWLPTILSC